MILQLSHWIWSPSLLMFHIATAAIRPDPAICSAGLPQRDRSLNPSVRPLIVTILPL